MSPPCISNVPVNGATGLGNILVQIARRILSSSSIGVGTKYIVTMYSSEPCMRQNDVFQDFQIYVAGKKRENSTICKTELPLIYVLKSTIRRCDQTLIRNPVRRTLATNSSPASRCFSEAAHFQQGPIRLVHVSVMGYLGIDSSCDGRHTP